MNVPLLSDASDERDGTPGQLSLKRRSPSAVEAVLSPLAHFSLMGAILIFTALVVPWAPRPPCASLD